VRFTIRDRDKYNQRIHERNTYFILILFLKNYTVKFLIFEHVLPFFFYTKLNRRIVFDVKKNVNGKNTHIITKTDNWKFTNCIEKLITWTISVFEYIVVLLMRSLILYDVHFFHESTNLT